MRSFRFMLSLGLLLVGALILTTPAAAGQGHKYGLIKQDLRAYFQDLTDQKLFSGTVLVARDDKILLMRGYGLANYEEGVRNRPQTVVAIASLTKAFASMSVMMLQEQGLLDIDDLIVDYIPAFPHHNITIRHVLSHSSGLFQYLNNPDLWANATNYHTPEELLDYFMYEPLNFPPGTQHQYSNSNYVVVGLIVEIVSDLSFRDYIALNILQPLGMESTSYDPFEVDFPDKAIGYDDITVDPPVETMYFHPSIPYAAGAMCSTVVDLYRWDQALYTEALVSASSLEELFTPGHGNYGLGWYIDNLEVDGEPHKQIWHWGSYFGFHGYIARLVDDRVTILVELNIGPKTDSPYELRPMIEDVAEIVFQYD